MLRKQAAGSQRMGHTSGTEWGMHKRKGLSMLMCCKQLRHSRLCSNTGTQSFILCTMYSGNNQ